MRIGSPFTNAPSSSSIFGLRMGTVTALKNMHQGVESLTQFANSKQGRTPEGAETVKIMEQINQFLSNIFKTVNRAETGLFTTTNDAFNENVQKIGRSIN